MTPKPPPPVTDRSGFIRAHTRLQPIPHAPEISLFLADEATALWEKTEEELGEIGLPPPFWAFAWAGGQALARYVLDHPQLVAGKRVLDFASGSGLVAIAAMKAGAESAQACDIDAFAIDAIHLNAQANGVDVSAQLKDLCGTDEGPQALAWDVVLAGDISYESDTAARVTDWLHGLHARGVCVLIGDPGRTYLARDRLVSLIEYQVPVTRTLEDAEIKKTSVWKFR